MPAERQDMTWNVLTHEHHERSIDWFWTVGTITLAGIVAAVYFGNILFAVIILIGSGCIGFLAARGPREHMIKIGERGISIDGTLYRWSALHTFWVEHDTHNPRLFLTMNGILSSHVSLELDTMQQGQEVRAHLKRHVEEEEQGPHIGEQLAEVLGL